MLEENRSYQLPARQLWVASLGSASKHEKEVFRCVHVYQEHIVGGAEGRMVVCPIPPEAFPPHTVRTSIADDVLLLFPRKFLTRCRDASYGVVEIFQYDKEKKCAEAQLRAENFRTNLECTVKVVEGVFPQWHRIFPPIKDIKESERPTFVPGDFFEIIGQTNDRICFVSYKHGIYMYSGTLRNPAKVQQYNKPYWYALGMGTRQTDSDYTDELNHAETFINNVKSIPDRW